MTANDTIKTNKVIKSIQSWSLLKCSIACIWLRGGEVRGPSHVCRQCIICHVLITYIDSFLQMNIRNDNPLQKAVKKLSGNDEGCGLGVWKRGEGCEREGRGSKPRSNKSFFFFFLYLKTKPLF